MPIIVKHVKPITRKTNIAINQIKYMDNDHRLKPLGRCGQVTFSLNSREDF